MPAPRSAGARQLDILIHFVERNKDVMAFSNGRTANNPVAKKEIWRKWEAIALKLNSIGPVRKAAKMWRQYWTELKYGARKKFAMWQKDPKKIIKLTDLDERILGVLGEHSVDGKMFQNIVREETPSPNMIPRLSRLTPKQQQTQPVSQQPVDSPQPDPLAPTLLVLPKMEHTHFTQLTPEIEKNHDRSSREDSTSPFNPPDWAVQLEMKQQELLQQLVEQSTRTNTLLQNMAGSLATVSQNLHNVLEEVRLIKDTVVNPVESRQS